MSLSSTRLHGLRVIRVLKSLFPSEYPRGANPTHETVGIVCLLLAVFLMLWAREWSRVFEVLLLFATLLSARRILREDPDAWVYLVLAGVVAWTLWVNYLASVAYPDWSNDSLEGTRDCARLFLFAIAGWWMGGHPRGIMVVVLVAAAGIVATIMAEVSGVPVIQWASLNGGAFGFRNSQHTAVVLATFLLALLVFGWRVCKAEGYGRYVRWTLAIAWLAALVVCLYMLRMTGNRQVWLGLFAAAIAGILLIWFGYGNLRARHPSNQRSRRAMLVSLAVVVLASMWVSADRAWQKFDREWPAITAYLTGQTESVELNSATVRLILWSHSLSVAAERPLLGYGGNSSANLIAASDLPPKIRNRFGHPHNSYLQLWTSYGIMAPLMFVVILFSMAVRVIKAWRHAFIATDVAIFFVGWLAFYALVNIFEAYVFYDSGILLTMIIGGAIYSATLPGRRKLARMRSNP